MRNFIVLKSNFENYMNENMKSAFLVKFMAFKPEKLIKVKLKAHQV